MSIENHPGYARWRAAEAKLEEAKMRLDEAISDGDRALALRQVDEAQAEYDAAVDAIVT